jgi:septum formation protein
VPPRPLVLASASPARLGVLRAAGLAPEVMVSGVDEEGVDGLAPGEMVEVLALRKAAAVAQRLGADGALVVGCDSMLSVAGELRGKPSSADEARRWWRDQRGATGTLHSGHAVVDTASGRRVSASSATVVRFGTPTDAEVDAYVASGEPLAVAGAFTIDGRGAPFVDAIQGDHGTVVGLSLPLLRRLLADLDVSIVELWAAPT